MRQSGFARLKTIQHMPQLSNFVCRAILGCMAHQPVRVILIKPSKYAADGFVERFRYGFMPNSTLAHLRSLTPSSLEGIPCKTILIDEYVQTDLRYLNLLQPSGEGPTLLALVGVQSHQMHRALDLAALAKKRGVEHCVIGGPHPMTCETTAVQDCGVSFAVAEAERIWPQILLDAAGGELSSIYGGDQRWQEALTSPALIPPDTEDLKRYVIRMMGIYPVRGCPYTCNFCSVIKIAGRMVRSQPVDTTIASLRAARAAGVRMIMFTSDNFNKYPEVHELLDAMIHENLKIPFFVQCDAQIYRQQELVEKLGLAGCFQMFIGVESFESATLQDAHKFQNHPEHYAEIIQLCRKAGILTHFSNILGFPRQTRSSILEHLRALRALRPDVASFYLLTPIPGTEQYEQFLQDGMIFEKNLDRFDGSTATWAHPHISPAELTDLLYQSYREFYNARDVLSKIAGMNAGDFRAFPKWNTMAGYPALSRVGAARRFHPMAGGAMHVRLDRAQDYADLRKDTFGFSLMPLPRATPLSAGDQELNRNAKLAVNWA